MVGFRYHVAAIAAIFAAVAVGLVGGSLVRREPAPAAAVPAPGAAQPPPALVSENEELKARLAQAESEAAGRELFTQQLAHLVLGPRLTGTRVLVLALPSGQSLVDDMVHMLTAAGADVTGQVTLTAKLTDPGNNAELVGLARTAVPPGVTTGLPATADGVDASTALLAAVLLKHTPEVTAGDSLSVLLAYSRLGYLDLGTGVRGPADAVVIVCGAVDPARAGPTLEAVSQFDAAGLAVAASPTAADDMLAARIRASPALSPTVSTVDDLVLVQGRFVAAWAVADQTLGKVGHYGTGAGAQLMPATLSS